MALARGTKILDYWVVKFGYFLQRWYGADGLTMRDRVDDSHTTDEHAFSSQRLTV